MELSIQQLGMIFSVVQSTMSGEPTPAAAEPALQSAYDNASPKERKEIRAGIYEALTGLSTVAMYTSGYRQKIDAALAAKGLPSLDVALASFSRDERP